MDEICRITTLIRSLAAASDRSPATVARWVFGDGRMYRRLEGGSDITTRRAAKAMQWLSDNWPADVLWPPDIPRPAPAPDSPSARADREYRESLGIRSERPVLRLNSHGQLANRRDLSAHLGDPDTPEWRQAYIDSYKDVVRDYADGAPKEHGIPRRGTRALKILIALCEAGDVRFARRAAAYLPGARAATAAGYAEQLRQSA